MKIKREIDGKEVEIELTGVEMLSVYMCIDPFLKILHDDFGFDTSRQMTKILAIESYKEYNKDSNNLSVYEVIEKIVDEYNLDRLSLKEYEDIV